METPEKIVIPITDSPLTMREVGIHLQHMNENIKDVKTNGTRREDLERQRFEEIKETLDSISTNHVTHIEFAEHLKRDEDHEARIRILEINSAKILSMIKTWGVAGGLLLGGLEVFNIIYSVLHTAK